MPKDEAPAVHAAPRPPGCCSAGMFGLPDPPAFANRDWQERLKPGVRSPFGRPDEVDAVVAAEALELALPTPGEERRSQHLVWSPLPPRPSRAPRAHDQPTYCSVKLVAICPDRVVRGLRGALSSA